MCSYTLTCALRLDPTRLNHFWVQDHLRHLYHTLSELFLPGTLSTLSCVHLENMSWKKCPVILFYFISFWGGAVLVLGLCCCAQVFSSCSRWGLLSSCAAGASCYSTCSYCGAHPGRAGFPRGSMRVQRLCHTGLVGCPAACGIFPDQGLNLCSLHWQADSYPLDHQGSSSSSD